MREMDERQEKTETTKKIINKNGKCIVKEVRKL